MIKPVKYILTLLLIFMVYIVISTSLKSNLFTELATLIQIPWMKATLWDFYANVFLILLWVIYKENNTWKSLLWALVFFFLGSLGTIPYVLLQISKLKSGESFTDLLSNQNNPANE